MPRAGGEADKWGNQYEALWTVEQILELISNNLAAITIEAIGDISQGVEFHTETDSGLITYHSVKRQKQGGDWSISDLTRKNAEGRSILGDLISKVSSGDSTKICFVSATGANALRELTERANACSSEKDFEKKVAENQNLLDQLDKLRSNCGLSPRDAFHAMQALDVVLYDQKTLTRNVIRIIDGLLQPLPGGPSNSEDMRLKIADYTLRQLGRRIDASRISQWLQDQKIGLRDWKVDPTVRQQVKTANLRYQRSVNSNLINADHIIREETTTIIETITKSDQQGAIIVANGGLGKSCVLAQVIEQLDDADISHLCLRLDTLEDCSISKEIGPQIGLEYSPATVLAGIADGDKCVLVVDQLDAVSLISGRKPAIWEAFADLCDDVSAHPNMKLLVACRKFDLEHDHRIRTLVSKQLALKEIKLDKLSLTDVELSFEKAGKEGLKLTDKEYALLQTPIHLYLFLQSQINSNFGSPSVIYEEYWSYKFRAVRDRLNRDSKWNEIVDVLTHHMSDQQTLQTPKARLSDLEEDAKAMVSEGVLILVEGNYRFFHETFFDYAHARQLCKTDISLVDFLTSSEQHLFRRAQARQILAYRRENDFSKYLLDLESVLSDKKVRFHIRRMAASWISTIESPNEREWDIVEKFLYHEDLGNRIQFALHDHVGWFDVMHSRELFDSWLNSEEEGIVNTTLWFLQARGLHDYRSKEIATILLPYLTSNRSEVLIDYADERDHKIANWIFSWGVSNKSKEMQDIFLLLCTRGVFDSYVRSQSNMGFWSNFCTEAAEETPRFFINVLVALFTRALYTYDFDSSRPLDHWRLNHSHNGACLVAYAASSEPVYFLEKVLPLFLRVTGLSDTFPTGRGRGRIWIRLRNHNDPYDVDDAILYWVKQSMRNLAKDSPVEFKMYSNQLMSSQHTAIHYVLLLSWESDPEKYCDEACEYFINNPEALDTGYTYVSGSTNGLMHCSIARQCLQAVTQYCSEANFLRLEDEILNFECEYEQAGFREIGFKQLLLLKSLDPTRTSSRINKHVAKLEKKLPDLEYETVKETDSLAEFRKRESPAWIGIAKSMEDAELVEAMAEHHDPNSSPFEFGLDELSMEVQKIARLDRRRFSELVLDLPESIHHRYFSSILNGLSGCLTSLQRSEREADLIDRSELPTEKFEDCISKLHSLPGRPCGLAIVHALGELSDRPFSSSTLDILSYYACNDPDPQSDEGFDLETQSLNCTRGAAARSIAFLLLSNEDNYENFQNTIQALAIDSIASVRVSCIEILIALLNFNRDAAVKIFNSSMNGMNEVWETHQFNQFLYNAKRTHYEDIRELMLEALRSDSAEAQSIVGGQIALAELYNYGDSSRDDLKLVLNGPEGGRVGAAQIYAGNLTDKECSEKVQVRIKQLFDDKSEKVRKQTAEAFFNLDSEQLLDFEDLILDYIQSPAYGNESEDLLRSLVNSNCKLPEVICLAAEKAIETCGNEVGDISKRAAMFSKDLSTLIVRQYEQAGLGDFKIRCLDIIDEMERVGFYGLGDELKKIDR